MDYRRYDNTLICRLHKGDEIMACITRIAALENIRAAYVTGIGATDNATVGTFDTSKSVYVERKFEGENMDIVSLVGNLSVKEGKGFPHLHIGLSMGNGEMAGGHLMNAVVSLTAEIFITVIDCELRREFDESVGIATFKF